MKLTILGTGNAAVSECYNTCFVLSDKEEHFLVDAGGGNRILKLLKDAGIELEDIHDIFVTHEHIDHVLGVIWLIRMIGQRMNQGRYEGDLPSGIGGKDSDDRQSDHPEKSVQAYGRENPVRYSGIRGTAANHGMSRNLFRYCIHKSKTIWIYYET